MMTRALMLVLASAVPATAQEAPFDFSPDLDVFEYGILCHYDDAFPGRPMTFEQVDATYASGELFDEVRVEKTFTVPGVSGMVIGVISSLRDGLAYDVVSTITRTNPAGNAIPDSLELSFDTQVEIDAWRFQQMGPDLLGTFRFQAVRGTETIYDVTLTVVPPEDYTGPYPECLSRP